jgi:hypothetical protein
MPLEAVDDIRCCCSILPSLLYIRVLLPKELLFCWTEALLCLVPLGALLLFDRNKVLDQAVLGKEGLQLAGLPQRRGLVQCRFLLMLLRHVPFDPLEAPGKACEARQALEPVEQPQPRDGYRRGRPAPERGYNLRWVEETVAREQLQPGPSA